MAYIKGSLEEYTGPFPNKIGDFCGNSHRTLLRLANDLVTVIARYHRYDLEEGRGGWQPVYHLRIGRPSNCQAGSSQAMIERGYVGLYLTIDAIPSRDGLDVDTDILQEEVVSGQRAPLKPFRECHFEKPVRA